jgi:hypothetical protein
MAAAKGHRPPNAGKGRKLGSQNKLTRSVKEAFEAVFKDMQADPKKPYALGAWGQNNPDEFYKLAAKLIPQDVKATVKATVTSPDLAVIASALGIPEKPD